MLGAHPRTAAEIKLMEGRFGPYVTDGTTNATLPKSLAPDQLTLEEAAQLIDERAAKGPPAKKGRGRKAPAKRLPRRRRPRRHDRSPRSSRSPPPRRNRPPPAPGVDRSDYHFRYLNRLDPREGWKRTISGVRYRRIGRATSGAHPAPTDTVTIHYVGRFIDGVEFDSSVARGSPPLSRCPG